MGPQFDRRSVFAMGAASAMASMLPAVARSATADGRIWLGAWGGALVPASDAAPQPAGTRYGQALTTSLGGSAIRLRLTNANADAALAVSGVTVRGSGKSGSAKFGGSERIDIPAGASVVTDPIALAVAPGEELGVELTLPTGGKLAAIHRTANRKGAWIETGGKRTEVPPALVDELQVLTTPRPVLVILSDTKSAGPETWPTEFARLAAGRIGVVNRSVFGGHLALGPARASALARFDRDVLGTAGVSHVLIFAGNNDLIQPGMIGRSGRPLLDPALMQTAAQLTGLLAQAATRAREAGIVALGATWLPYEGVTIAKGYSSPEKIALREAVNRWIRSPGAFDKVVDFDAALRDSTHPARLAPDFDGGNHFTPNAAGYAAMAQAMLRAIS